MSDEVALPDRDELVEVILRWRGQELDVTGHFTSFDMYTEPLEMTVFGSDTRTYAQGPSSAILRLHDIRN